MTQSTTPDPNNPTRLPLIDAFEKSDKLEDLKRVVLLGQLSLLAFMRCVDSNKVESMGVCALVCMFAFCDTHLL